jgi:hypothetical protein
MAVVVMLAVVWQHMGVQVVVVPWDWERMHCNAHHPSAMGLVELHFAAVAAAVQAVLQHLLSHPGCLRHCSNSRCIQCSNSRCIQCSNSRCIHGRAGTSCTPHPYHPMAPLPLL